MPVNDRTPLSTDTETAHAATPAAWHQHVTTSLELLATNRLVHLLILSCIVFYCFGRTLSSYFLADDFGEILYIHHIFHGQPALFWSNFTGNYMQIPSMSVYRPWLLVSLVIDYLVWGARAFGFYLSNILYFIGTSCFLYLLIERLTASWHRTRSRLAAFFAAALFASYPLHCESISWVVGRVDIVCCFFYLLSLYLLVVSSSLRSYSNPPATVPGESLDKNPAGAPEGRIATERKPLWNSSHIALAASLASFWLALTTKEMAIGLPVVASAIGFLQLRNQHIVEKDTQQTATKFEHESNVQRPRVILSRSLRSALSLSCPFWLLAALYFVVRYLALGTLTGGYTGGIGASQFGAIVSKWTDLDSVRRLFFPLNYSVFHDAGIYLTLLVAIYCVLAIILSIRLLGRDMPWRWLLLAAAWLASAAAPIYQLWGLGYNLEGSRFAFFLSVPLCIIPAVLTLAPRGQHSEIGKPLAQRLSVIGTIILSALVVLFARISYLNNIPWVQAGKTVASVARQAQLLCQKLAPGETIAVLGIPKEHSGAHMILNGATFAMMLSEPFVKQASAQHFLTFDPVMFGDPDAIDPTRFKELLAKHLIKGVFVWRADDHQWISLDLVLRTSQSGQNSASSKTSITARAGETVNFTRLDDRRGGSRAARWARPDAPLHLLGTRLAPIHLGDPPAPIHLGDPPAPIRLGDTPAPPGMVEHPINKLQADRWNTRRGGSRAARWARPDAPLRESQLWEPCTAGNATYRATAEGIEIWNPSDGDGITISGLNISPLAADYLELTIRTVRSAAQSKLCSDECGQQAASTDDYASVAVSWHGTKGDGATQPIRLQRTKDSVKILIPLSRYWRWYAADSVKSLKISFTQCPSLELTQVQLLPESLVVPTLTLSGPVCSLRGVFEGVSDATTLAFDSSHIPDATATLVEVSRPNYFFDRTHASVQKDAIMTRRTANVIQGTLKLNTFSFPAHSYYQIRARSLNHNGVQQGDYSNPLTIQW